MGQRRIGRRIVTQAGFGVCALAILLSLTLTSTAQAVPFHKRAPSLDVTTGLNHACGAAVDSKGDLYLASAGESKIKVYDPSHVLLAEISNANTPCGLAVTSTGNLYVSEKATGEVVRYKPNAYPFLGTPTYGAREVIDASGNAEGIAVDRTDDRLYVAEGNHVAIYKSDGELEGIDEVQTVSVSKATGGTFKLKFKGQETAPIKFDATAAEVKGALEAMSSIGAGNVSVSGTYAITFTGALAHTDVEALGTDSTGLTGSEAEVTVTETTKGFGRIGVGTLTEASGVAAYTYTSALGTTDRYLWVADARGLVEKDRLYLFGSTFDGKPLSLRRELNGSTTPDGSFGFGTAGAYLAADPGNRNSKGECIVVGEQACTAGHLFLYDAAHKALHEFDASGGYLTSTANAAFADAEPTAVAIDRSGGSGDGTLYVTAGAGAGAKALAFGPLKAPSRKALKKPSEEAGGLSQELKNARAVATDSFGNVYVAADTAIHVYGPSGAKITEIEDPGKPRDLAVDSACNVYVFDENEGFSGEAEVTYYDPSKCPPDSGTTYSRNEPPIATPEDFPTGKKAFRSIAVNPGPGPGKDHLFVSSFAVTHEHDSAANGSTLLDEAFATCVANDRQSVAVDGPNGIVYFAGNSGGTNSAIIAVDATTGECLRRFESTGAPGGKKAGLNPAVAVDQASGHVVAFDGVTSTAREYDGAGSFVAAFGTFTEGLNLRYRVAVAPDGTVYVAFDDTNPSHPPYDVSAFGPLTYPEPLEHKLTVEKTGTGSGKVTSSPAGIDCGSDCDEKYDETEVVTLTATADPENEFIGWGEEDCEAEEEISPTEGICEVTMSEAREVSAEFDAEGNEFELEVEPVGPGSGKVTSQPGGIECPSKCVAKFVEKVNVSLAAAADEKSEFVKWSGCDSVGGNGECLISLTSNRKVTVEFDVLHPLLTVVKQGAGTGTVTSEEPGIDCGSTCTHKYDLGDEVTLEAEADPGSKFAGWSDCDAEAEPEPGIVVCELTMEEPRQVIATFTTLPQVKVKPALPVLYHEATLRGEVNTAELATEYRFEYLTEEEYEDNGETFEGAQPTPEGELEPSKGFVPVEASLTGLEEGTEYRFRLRAMNSAGSAEDEGVFETLQRTAIQSCANTEYRTGLSANLPDCRAYELVTPAQTNGLTPNQANDGGTPSGSFSNWLTVQRGEEAGERLSYFTDGTLPGFEGTGRLDGYRAKREPGEHPPAGWQSSIFSPSYAESAPGLSHFALQHGISSDQGYSIWEINPEPETFPQTLPQGVYLRTPTGFEPVGLGSLGEDLGALSRYVSAGGAHVIFASKEHLEDDAPPEGNMALYDRAAGSASSHVLTMPPVNSSEEEEEFLSALRSKEQASFSGASEDGAAVVFNAGVGLYVRLDHAVTQKLSPTTAEIGDTISCAAGPLLGLKDPREFKWLRNGTPISSEKLDDVHNVAVYTTTPGDAGTAFQCLSVARESGTGSVAISAPVPIVPLGVGKAPRPPLHIAAPTPPAPVAGTVESCAAGSWQDTESLAYQWYSDGEAIPGATSQTYEVQAGDVPGTLQCVVSGANTAATVARASGLTPTSPAPAEAAPVATAQAALKTTYAGASEDGRYVFFALGGGEEQGRLFRFDTQSESATEFAPAGRFVGVSPDGTNAFFSSTKALTGSEENGNGEKAQPGLPNLYAWDGTGLRFVASLSAMDFKQNAFGGIGDMNLSAWTRSLGLRNNAGRAYAPTRSTPDGEVFVFQSHARLTAYDNEEVGEIYRYDPAAEMGKRLLCVSCDPSGAPPSSDALLQDIRGLNVVPLKPKTMIANVTDSGDEVFFQSFDRLLPEDANEVEDVYEWKAAGVGGCTRPGGCLSLISSGQGETPSFLYAMSADGRDVFLHTKEKLVGADVAGSPSIYDARVGGGIPEPATPAPCQGDACQGQGSEPPVLPSPATTGAGGGNKTTPARQRCAKGKRRVKGRCVRVKRHKRRHHHRVHSSRGGKR